MFKVERYIEQLEYTLSDRFTVIRQPVVASRSFLLSAHHSCTIGRTLLTPKDVIDKFDVQTIILVITAESMNHVIELCRLLRENIREIVRPDSQHYLSLINLVLVFKNPVPEDIRNFVERYSFTKSFLLSLHGWAQAGITGVCLEDGAVFCGKSVSDMKKLFEPRDGHASSELLSRPVTNRSFGCE